MDQAPSRFLKSARQRILDTSNKSIEDNSQLSFLLLSSPQTLHLSETTVHLQSSLRLDCKLPMAASGLMFSSVSSLTRLHAIAFLAVRNTLVGDGLVVHLSFTSFVLLQESDSVGPTNTTNLIMCKDST